MAIHSSVLAWRIPGTGEPWWAVVYGVAQSRTRLKQQQQNNDRRNIHSLTFSSVSNCFLPDPMDGSLPSSSVRGILLAEILEWVPIPFFRGSSQPRDQTLVTCIAGRFLTPVPPGKSIICVRNPRGILFYPPNVFMVFYFFEIRNR